MERRIICAAIRNTTDRLILGVRHFDSIMHRAIEMSGDDWTLAEQGFVDNRGQFLDREAAWAVAVEANQVARRVGGDSINGGRLFSENLY